MPKIKIQITRNLVQVIDIDRPITLGRGKEADLVILDQLVSRRHVTLTSMDGSVVLEDLDSANGTFVNKVRVHSQLLEHGDRIEIGKTQILYSTEEREMPLRMVDLTGTETLADYDPEELASEPDIQYKFLTVDEIARELVVLSGRMLRKTSLAEEAIAQFEIGMGEAIGNAVRHGHKYQKDKIIKYRWTRTPDRVLVRVEDTGPGFDYRAAIQKGLELDAASAARKRHAEGGMGGLGILMMLRCVDRVEYNRLGNEVTLTKFLTDSARQDEDDTSPGALRPEPGPATTAEEPPLDETYLADLTREGDLPAAE
ncbi:MAG: ATP-binding protein [Planctomycetes bacterium]|nr:ATP-binding protein [Planctomycetota bacterium]